CTWIYPIEEIVSADHAQPKHRDPPYRKPHNQRHRDDAPTKNPDHSAVCPGDETPREIDDRKLSSRSHKPRLKKNHESCGMDFPRLVDRNAPVPARNANTGAQK